MSYKLKKIKWNGRSDMRYPDAFAEKFILEYTKKGDKVFDPFSGFGTTLTVAQKLGRIGIGIEYEKDRCDYISKKLKSPNKVIHGSSLKIKDYKLPKFDFCITSPPYMRSFDPENPFSNYSKKGSYAQYLKDIKKIYTQIKQIMKKNATIVIEIQNTFGKGHPMTPLAWDVSKEISKVFHFERELVYCYTNGELKPNSTNHSYCLIFKNK